MNSDNDKLRETLKTAGVPNKDIVGCTKEFSDQVT
jgi:hypothetical protein